MKKKLFVLPLIILLSFILVLGSSMISYGDGIKVAASGTATGTASRTSTSTIEGQGVTFFDSELVRALNKELGQDPDSKITELQLKSITSLDLSSKNISNISGLEYCTNLKELNISHNNIVDFKPLANLRRLEYLDISYNYLASLKIEERCYSGSIDLYCLNGLLNLKVLKAKSAAISDVSFMSNMAKLEQVNLSENYILDISPLLYILEHDSIKSLDISNQYVMSGEIIKTKSETIDLKCDIGCINNKPEISDLSCGKYMKDKNCIRVNANEIFKNYPTEGMITYKFKDPSKYTGKDFEFNGRVLYYVFLDDTSTATPASTATVTSKIAKVVKTDKKNKAVKTSDSNKIPYCLGIAGLSLGTIILAKKKFM